MPRRVILARRAQFWFDAELVYLGQHSAGAAQRAAEGLANALHQLAEFPRSGFHGPIPGTRRLVIGPYVLTYREIGPELLLIIDIRHGRQREPPVHELESLSELSVKCQRQKTTSPSADAREFRDPPRR